MKYESNMLGLGPEPSDKSRDDSNYCTIMGRWILQFIGIWPVDRQTSIIINIIAGSRVLICYFLILFLLIPGTLHTFLDEKDQRKKLKMIGPLLYYLTVLAKYSFLVARRNDIHQCLDQVSEDWHHCTSLTDQKIMSNSAKLSRLIASVCILFTYSCTLFFRLIMPLSTGRRIGPNNITIRPLGTPVYKPLFAADESPSYEIVYTLQTMSSVVVGSVTIGSGSLAAVFVLYACGQLRIVMSRLNSFVGGSKRAEDISGNQMGEIVELHLRVLNFIERVEGILNEVCLVEFVASIINICLMLYYMVTEIQQAETIAVMGYCILVISFTFNIYILCYIGEILGEQVNNVGSTAYMIDWHKLLNKHARGLILLIAMTNYPCRITAGKMAELSFKSFSSVIKTSMGYFNLLRKVTS